MKATVLREFVSSWPTDAVRRLESGLDRVAIHGAHGADLIALGLLALHQLRDVEWIADRLEYKRRHDERRLAEIAEIGSMPHRER